MIWAGGLIALVTTWLPAASVLDFPRLSFEPDVITGIAIVNPTGADAEVMLTAYGAGGGVLGTSQLTVPAGRQVSRVAAQLFEGEFDPSAIAWFQGFSMTTGLSGFFLILNAAGTEFDGADLPQRARRLAFNQIRVGEGVGTELNLVNTSGETAQVELTLVGAGEEPLVRELELASRGVARLDVGTFFEAAEVAAGAFILVQLGPFETRLGLVNHSAGAVIVSVTAHGPDGGLFVEEVRANPVAVSLAPGESLNQDLVELFGFQGEDALEGWLEVTSTSPAINGYLELRVPSTGAAATLTPVAQGTSNAVFSHLATSLGFFTGLAMLNSGSLPADVRLVAQSVSGQLLGTFDVVLQPGQRISRLVTDIIPEAGGQAGGLLLVRSNIPVFASALFGTLEGTVLSNIPGQPAFEDFRPDAGLPVPQVVPRLAIVQTAGTQSFRVDQLGGQIEWLVNGVEGGSPETGTITTAGVYTAPAAAPSELPVVITAVSGAQSAGGSVDVISLESITSGLGFVQSLAFLGSLQRLYTAELSAIGGFSSSGDGPLPKQGLASTIFGMGDDGDRVPLVDLQDEIPKMIPFEGRAGMEYLLVAGQATGRVLRIDPRTAQTKVVGDDLDAPGALVFDPVTGNLLVAEAEQVSSIPRRQLESDLTPALVQPDPGKQPGVRSAVVARIGGIAGLAVDACTGRIYLAQQGSGLILDFERDSGQSNQVLEGLVSPGQMAGFYRAGVSCPDSFQLLIVEEGAEQVTLLAPALGEVISPWIPDIDMDDITLLPEDSPFGGRVAFDMTMEDDGGGGMMTNNLLGVELPGLYDEGPAFYPRLRREPLALRSDRQQRRRYS